MKKNMTLALAGVLASGLFIASCSGSKGQNGVAATDSVAASAMDASQAVSVDTTASTLSWKGFKPGGEHYGKLPVSEGALDLKDGILRAGSVTIHLGALTVEDMKPGEGGDKLKAHLLSEDFFDVAKYPEVKFELTDIPAEGIRWYGHHPASVRHRHAYPRRVRGRLDPRHQPRPPPGTTATGQRHNWLNRPSQDPEPGSSGVMSLAV